jgi:hypothetical protein
VLLLHLVNRLLAVVVSLAVTAAAALAAIEVARWFVGASSLVAPWRDWTSTLSDARAGDDGLLVASAVAALLGLLLLLFELKPRRPDVLATEPLLPGVDAVVTRRGLASTATTAARGVSGVVSADSAVRRRTVSVTARTPARGTQRELRGPVKQAVEQALADLELRRRPKVRVSVAEES